MQPATHLLMSWSVAEAILPVRRDRLLAAWAGVVPDLDGFGYPVQVLTADWERPLSWYSDYHHVLGHGVTFGLVWAALTFACAQQRLKATLAALLIFHLHLGADLIGSGGPDGSSWPIVYGWPFSLQEQVAPIQWALDAWPNYVVGIGLLLWVGYRTWRTGRSPLDMLSRRMDATLVAAVEQRFGRPQDREAVPSASAGAEKS
jgi:inner membrane protein